MATGREVFLEMSWQILLPLVSIVVSFIAGALALRVNVRVTREICKNAEFDRADRAERRKQESVALAGMLMEELRNTRANWINQQEFIVKYLNSDLPRDDRFLAKAKDSLAGHTTMYQRNTGRLHLLNSDLSQQITLVYTAIERMNKRVDGLENAPETIVIDQI